MFVSKMVFLLVNTYEQDKNARETRYSLLVAQKDKKGKRKNFGCLLFASTPLLHSDSSLLAVLTSACQNARLVGVDFFFFFFIPQQGLS